MENHQRGTCFCNLSPKNEIEELLFRTFMEKIMRLGHKIKIRKRYYQKWLTLWCWFFVWINVTYLWKISGLLCMQFRFYQHGVADSVRSMLIACWFQSKADSMTVLMIKYVSDWKYLLDLLSGRVLWFHFVAIQYLHNRKIAIILPFALHWLHFESFYSIFSMTK